MYVNAWGVPESSLSNAYMWAWLAREQGNEQAAIYVQALEQELSPAEIETAKASASACSLAGFEGC
jgi:hypothetical protein